ncbi:MAG TPA: MerR family transcriptional regulator [Microthrixaceae bacterium]|nr:MerR family transcriptional regulator [Microthrixaceae bacterium]
MTRPEREGGGASSDTTPVARSWSERLDDPDEPLYTVAVVCDLLGLDSQTLRRLGVALEHGNARPSGNQRRYSRSDIESLAAAVALVQEGIQPNAVGRILDLERQVEVLSRRRAR